MEITTTIENVPKILKSLHAPGHTSINLTIDETPSEKGRYIQIGDKSAFETFEAVKPARGSRFASDIVYEQRKQGLE